MCFVELPTWFSATYNSAFPLKRDILLSIISILKEGGGEGWTCKPGAHIPVRIKILVPLIMNIQLQAAFRFDSNILDICWDYPA